MVDHHLPPFTHIMPFKRGNLLKVHYILPPSRIEWSLQANEYPWGLLWHRGSIWQCLLLVGKTGTRWKEGSSCYKCLDNMLKCRIIMMMENKPLLLLSLPLMEARLPQAMGFLLFCGQLLLTACMEVDHLHVQKSVSILFKKLKRTFVTIYRTSTWNLMTARCNQQTALYLAISAV